MTRAIKFRNRIESEPLVTLQRQNAESVAGGPDTSTMMGYRDVEVAIDYCERQIRRMVRKGTFPAPTRIGAGRALGWPASAVAEWIASKDVV